MSYISPYNVVPGNDIQFVAPNMEFLTGVLTAKQQRYENTFKQLASLNQGYMDLDIFNDETKAKLDASNNEINSWFSENENSDFSDSRVVENLLSKFDAISKDPEILSAVKTTSAFRTQLAQIEQSKKDGKYNSTSATNVLQSLEKYKTAVGGDKLDFQTHQYTPDCDYMKNITSGIKSLEASVYADFDGAGFASRGYAAMNITKKLSPENIYNYLSGISDECMKSQKRESHIFNYNNDPSYKERLFDSKLAMQQIHANSYKNNLEQINSEIKLLESSGKTNTPEYNMLVDQRSEINTSYIDIVSKIPNTPEEREIFKKEFLSNPKLLEEGAGIAFQTELYSIALGSSYTQSLPKLIENKVFLNAQTIQGRKDVASIRAAPRPKGTDLTDDNTPVGNIVELQNSGLAVVQAEADVASNNYKQALAELEKVGFTPETALKANLEEISDVVERTIVQQYQAANREHNYYLNLIATQQDKAAEKALQGRKTTTSGVVGEVAGTKFKTTRPIGSNKDDVYRTVDIKTEDLVYLLPKSELGRELGVISSTKLTPIINTGTPTVVPIDLYLRKDYQLMEERIRKLPKEKVVKALIKHYPDKYLKLLRNTEILERYLDEEQKAFQALGVSRNLYPIKLGKEPSLNSQREQSAMSLIVGDGGEALDLKHVSNISGNNQYISVDVTLPAAGAEAADEDKVFKIGDKKIPKDGNTHRVVFPIPQDKQALAQSLFSTQNIDPIYQKLTNVTGVPYTLDIFPKDKPKVNVEVKAYFGSGISSGGIMNYNINGIPLEAYLKDKKIGEVPAIEVFRQIRGGTDAFYRNTTIQENLNFIKLILEKVD